MDDNMPIWLLNRLVIDNFLDNAQMRIVRQVNREFSQYEIQQELPVVSVLETVKTVHNLQLAISQGMKLTEANITTLAASGRKIGVGSASANVNARPHDHDYGCGVKQLVLGAIIIIVIDPADSRR
jgi:hypothetical protein